MNNFMAPLLHSSGCPTAQATPFIHGHPDCVVVERMMCEYVYVCECECVSVCALW